MYLTGVLQALGVVLVSAIFNIYVMYCNQNYNINPTIFTFFCILATSWTMLIVSGPGRFAKGTMFNKATWIQGLSLIANMILAIYLIKYVTSAEGAILRRLSVPVSIILAFFLFSRKPMKSDFISFFVLAFSGFFVIFMQDQNLTIILLLSIVAAFTQCTSFMLAETHTQSSQAQSVGDIRDRGRVVAMSTFVTASIFFVIIAILSTIDFFYANIHLTTIIPFTPKLEEFLSTSSIVSGLVFGFFLSPFLRYFIWSASYKIKSENVLTILALIPLVTFIFQFLASSIGLLDINYTEFNNNYNKYIFLLTIAMTIGAGTSAYIKSYAKIKEATGNNILEKIKNSSKVESDNLAIGFSANNMADYEIVKNTLDFYEGDIEKTSEILEIPIDTVKALAIGKNTYSLRDDVSKKVHDIFRNKIFYLDQLTGVENKKGLIRQFSEYKNNKIDFSLYYMDINKFKSINDTYGHNIGDVIIIQCVKRISEYAQDNQGFAYRLSGDEIAFITTSEKNEERIIKEIKKIISQPINYNCDGKSGIIEPSISIGKANIIKESNLKIADILSSADQNMYKDKKDS